MNKSLENPLNNQNSPIINSPTNSSVDQELSWNAILASVITPLVPALMAKLTGAKFPVNPITNAPTDQGTLSQLTPVIQNLVNTQNLLLQEIILLKNNAQSIANSFQSLRLTHKKEEKQIELGTNQGDFNKSTHFNAQQNQNSNDHE